MGLRIGRGSPLTRGLLWKAALTLRAELIASADVGAVKDKSRLATTKYHPAKDLKRGLRIQVLEKTTKSTNSYRAVLGVNSIKVAEG
ncbi:hypothetical protein SRHO_G00110620 [Serrasalmus rhombeus]